MKSREGLINVNVTATLHTSGSVESARLNPDLNKIAMPVSIPRFPAILISCIVRGDSRANPANHYLRESTMTLTLASLHNGRFNYYTWNLVLSARSGRHLHGCRVVAYVEKSSMINESMIVSKNSLN